MSRQPWPGVDSAADPPFLLRPEWFVRSWDIEAVVESHVHVTAEEPTSLAARDITMAPFATFEDSTLIKLALAGQAESFTVLTNRHLPAVRRSVGSIVPNITDADDVIQEVLLKVWRHLSTFRLESTFRTWMTRVAVNEALQSYRRERRRSVCQALDDFETFASPIESPLLSLTRAETTQVVRNAVRELPAKYRLVLTLRDLEQLSLRETARMVQSSVPAVKTRLFRGRLMLRAAIQRFTDPTLGSRHAREGSAKLGDSTIKRRKRHVSVPGK
jgi:RNA polymerase sigma-70 factor (ECF subfamily)